MGSHDHHEELISGLKEQLQPLFESSPQGIYIYLDDTHKACNEKLATFLGCSVKEWDETESILETFTAKVSHPEIVETYHTVKDQLVAKTIEPTLITKSGDQNKTHMTMVPMIYQGHVIVLHFIELN